MPSRPKRRGSPGAPSSVPAKLQRKNYRADSVIFREGDAGGRIFIVEHGLVEISKFINGNKVTLGALSGNDIFGELSALDSGPRTATATAVEDTVCLIVPKSEISTKLKTADPLTQAMIKILMRNNRAAATRIAQ